MRRMKMGRTRTRGRIKLSINSSLHAHLFYFPHSFSSFFPMKFHGIVLACLLVAAAARVGTEGTSPAHRLHFSKREQ
jgi:hypothetical protein